MYIYTYPRNAATFPTWFWKKTSSSSVKVVKSTVMLRW